MELESGSFDLPPRGPKKDSLVSEDAKPRRAVPLASSKAETVLVSSSYDVLTCRDREGPYPNGESTDGWSGYAWHEDFALLCCDADVDDNMSAAAQETNICNPWGNSGGLLGGAEVATALSPATDNSITRIKQGLSGGGENFPTSSPWKKTTQPENLGSRAKQAFRSPPLRSEGAAQNQDDAESIVPIKSFDYSHYGGDGSGNDMLPERKQAAPRSPPTLAAALPASIPHGVPKFMSGFNQVKVKQVSAHPLGSHVLLISEVNLLYSYGLNDYGQLGIGIQSPKNMRYIMHPNIVTPLAEHGGKAILCAAGVTHSLVVVATEERRLTRSQSDNELSRPCSESNENGGVICYHQLYGFGRNDYTKIGLVSPKIAKPGSNDEMEHVTLPHRVALRCKVRPDSKKRSTNQGIFCVAAGAEHSAALVRRSSGDVELYTWGNAMYGALGLPPQAMEGLGGQLNDHTSLTAVKLVPVPSFVASLSRTSNPGAKKTCLLEPNECPVSLSLGRRCSLVLTNSGRCFSFGFSDEGILGLGEQVTEAQEPSEIPLPDNLKHDRVIGLHAGGAHAVATLKSGRVIAWGQKANVGFAVTGENTEQIAWTPSLLTNIPSESNTDESENPMRILQSTAGYDNIVMVSTGGRVLSCGRGSGRLGLGEVTDEIVGEPRPLFGGLRLWQRNPSLSINISSPPSRPIRHNKSFSNRGISVS